MKRLNYKNNSVKKNNEQLNGNILFITIYRLCVHNKYSNRRPTAIVASGKTKKKQFKHSGYIGYEEQKKCIIFTVKTFLVQ